MRLWRVTEPIKIATDGEELVTLIAGSSLNNIPELSLILSESYSGQSQGASRPNAASQHISIASRDKVSSPGMEPNVKSPSGVRVD